MLKITEFYISPLSNLDHVFDKKKKKDFNHNPNSTEITFCFQSILGKLINHQQLFAKLLWCVQQIIVIKLVKSWSGKTDILMKFKSTFEWHRHDLEHAITELLTANSDWAICQGCNGQINSSTWWLTGLLLTRLPLDKMANILQTLFSDAFAWMKSFVFW